MQHRGVFITGTDTGVGKTHIAKGVIEALRRQGRKVAAFKPIVTGGMSDVKMLAAENVYAFKAPLAPSVAARLEHRNISIDKILSRYRWLCLKNDFVVVEGIGGIMVPIKKGYFVSDLIKDMDIPVVIVARPGLGTINHILLTISHARACGIKILGVVFNETKKVKMGICERTNPKEIERQAGVPILGWVKYGAKKYRLRIFR
jgi:dethiobiotin synthetase